ncbi:Molybdenum ABC transporter, periplasmic molybdenum-binding protein ModA (TC 3.A.1.8.1) [Nitrospira tepida]|uniref:Molybdenum ABC transporter, periplasmic molybdenum-binding protein ModA (TC 3.A.1.8.1) n=1 Tax=Nitrospira tepida TaxID=2973512 RepID=A0AA86MYY9_9BACT|nr:molybdate ABC transporter substrate-binding protein [Nitrospira tepida]CAI4031556.1 Molybdenum ABC transporter, periplasmic molybdenum-binding protein ModA (TC 3.A.1.8.1) [Nitrospira tepida]
MMRVRLWLVVYALAAVAAVAGPSQAGQSRETFVIAGSPSLAVPLKALAEAYEAKHPNVKVLLYFDNGLDLRRTIAGMENSMVGQYFIGKGPIHLVAPGGDELITRLEQKYYVLPGTKRAYAQEHLVLVVPESLVEAPASFEELGQNGKTRVAIADAQRTKLGLQTQGVLQALDLADKLKGRLDVASDSRGVLDHVLSGEADMGIVFEHEAVKEQERVRIVARADRGYQPIVHSMAMERYCPNRTLCEDFLAFIQTAEAQDVVRLAGYGVPGEQRAGGVRH